MPAAAMAALAAALPSCTAVSGVSAPWNAPIGVRLAETMTTSWLDIWNLQVEGLFSGRALARRGGRGGAGRGGRQAGRAPPPPPPPAKRGGAGPRPQSALENGDERLRVLRTVKALVLTIPVRNPVERAGERKRGHFRIARLNGAVLHTLADQPPDAVIDLGLQGLDVAAHGRRQVLVLGAHHAPAEFGCHRLTVMAQHRIQALARRHLEAAHVAKRRPDLLDSRHE